MLLLVLLLTAAFALVYAYRHTLSEDALIEELIKEMMRDDGDHH